MNIIIPLGGLGQRFADNKYTRPKPLVKVLGKEIIFWLLDSISISKKDKVYIPYNQFLDSYQFEEIILSKYPNIKLLSLPPTNGPVETLRLCLEHFQIDGKIALLDGDTWYEEDIIEKIRNIDQNFTAYFKTNLKQPIYSYIKIKDNQIIEIREKNKISEFANTGCYVFKDAKQVLKYISKIQKQSERYISDIISKMLKDDIYFFSLKVQNFHVLGTPQQIINFSRTFPFKSKRFVFDLDNTLVTFPRIKGDYSTVLPISNTINFLKKLKSNGHYIIIYTARRMKTHNGNVEKVIEDIKKVTIEKLKEFNIPYDELVFGKPYAHYYIDDLMINPKTDLNKELGIYFEDVVPRYFNKLIYSSKTVKKISDDSKLEGESYYYEEIQKFSIGKYFPKILSAKKGEIVIEKIDGTNLSTLYINELLNKKNIESLISITKEIHSAGSNGKFTKYYDYNEKLLNRFNSFDYSKFGVEKKEFLNIKKEVSMLKGDYKIIHGDLVFSNIMLNNEGNFKFIDVKGKFGNKLSIFGDPFYDFAKFFQSLIGYDEILLEKNVQKNYKDSIIKCFNEHFNDDELLKIKKITKSLLLSLIPLHDDKSKILKYIDLCRSIKTS